MLKTWTTRILFAAVLITVVSVTPAAAQTFEAEIDCNGTWNQGSSVPYTVRFEEQGFITHQITTSVKITVPGFGQLTLLEGTFTLNPNQDRDITRNLNLPQTAPNGSYQMSVTADDGAQMAFDTCSFNVQ